MASHEAMKKSDSRNSESSTQFHSPMHWDGTDPPEMPEYRSRESSPAKHAADDSFAITVGTMLKQLAPDKRAEPRKPPDNAMSAVTLFTGSAAEEPQRPPEKALPSVGGDERKPRLSPVRRKSVETASKAALGFRLSEVVVCLISFSVMAADKTQGWSGDSYDRYIEYRYCLSVNAIGFAYSALQACDLACKLATGKHLISHHLRYHFDFFMDQVMAYLLISASSSAATRVEDWQSNWGKDEFTEMATASIGMSFLAFVAYAMSSLISGYTFCNRSSI
ncbi:hypothetical protein Fmac_008831 [Flemingia macrophylla]|uniref:CASP-like protein n=1 Tax=Flemingia macrophylla TaxID=520843 RepID=A0ABD1MZ21_9FABA